MTIFNSYDVLNLVLNLFGLDLHLSDSSSPFLLFICSIFILSVVSIFCGINIMLYLFSLYITNHPYFLSKISSYYYIVKFIQFYRTTRIAFLIFELILFWVNLGGLCWLCYQVIKDFD